MIYRNLKFISILCLQLLVVGICIGCISSKTEEVTYNLESYSNFNFLKDLSSDNLKTPKLKVVMDLSAELQKLLDTKKYDEAIVFLKTYLKDHPQDIDTKYKLAYLLYFRERFSEGIEVISWLLEQKIESFSSKYDQKYELLYADLLIEDGQIDKAYQVLKELVREHPCSRAYTFLAKVYMKQHKYDASLYAIKKALDRYYSYESEQKELETSEDFVDNFKAIDDSKILDSKSEIYFWMSYLSIYNGEFEKAKTYLDGISNKYKMSPSVLYLYGLYQFSINQFDESFKYVSDLNKLHPSFRGFYLESKIYEKKKDQDHQVLSLQRSLEYKDDSGVKLELASIYSLDPDKHYEAYILANDVQQKGSIDQQHEAKVIISKLDNKK